MRLVLVLFASFMLAFAMPALATPPGGCPPGHQNIDSCDDDDDSDDNGGGNGGGYGDVNIDINGTVDVDNSNTTTIGDTTATGGNATGGDATVGDVSGGSINIYGGGEEGGDAPFSNNNEIDNSSNSTSTSTATTGDNTNLNTNIVGGGQGGAGGEGGQGGEGGSVNVGDTTLNNGGNTLIVGGQGGECYEGECGGDGGTLNSNAENNVDIDNSSSATGGEGGDATIEGGAVVVENNVTIEGGNDVPTANNQTVEGDETEINVDARTINEAHKPAVNSVAPSFSGICNSGAAGQGRSFALSLAVTNDVCQCLMIADAYMAIGDVEEAHNWVRAAARHAKWKGGVGYIRHLVTLGIL